MSWSYSGNPATSQRDEVRFLVGDTNAGTPLMADAELDYVIGYWMPIHDSLLLVAATVADLVAIKFASLVPVAADGVNVGIDQLAQRFRDVAARLREAYHASAAGGEVDIDALLATWTPDSSIVPGTFAMRMHDNPAAGLQDFGSWVYDPWSDSVAYGLVPGAPGESTP